MSPRREILVFLSLTLLLSSGFYLLPPPGLIWSVWHYPLIFAFLPRFRPGLPVAYATACVTASVVGVSFFYTWLRQATGSVWPAVILHAASNNAQTLFEALTRNTGRTYYFTYEYGIGFVLAIWIFLAFFRKRFSRGRGLGLEQAAAGPHTEGREISSEGR